MWQIGAVLPPFSNREDYLVTLSVFDDDTLLPVDLSGITLAGGNSFTSNAWTVTDGAINTTSATSFTIPMFPVTGTNNLTALTITVGTNLAIKPGDAITIKDTATGLNSVVGFVTSYTASNGSLTVQIGWTFQFEIRRGGARNTGSGFIPWWDWGTPDDLGPLLTASFSNGFLSLISNNVVQILIPESVIRTIGSTSLFAGQGDAPGTYQACMTGADGAPNTRQFLFSQQPFYHGGVTI